MADGAIAQADVFPARRRTGIFPSDQHGHLPEGQALGFPGTIRGKRPTPHMNWETVNPEMVGGRAEYICVAFDERGSGQIAGQFRAPTRRRRVDRLLDGYRMGAISSLSNGQGSPHEQAKLVLFSPHAVGGWGEPHAAVAEHAIRAVGRAPADQYRGHPYITAAFSLRPFIVSLVQPQPTWRHTRSGLAIPATIPDTFPGHVAVALIAPTASDSARSRASRRKWETRSTCPCHSGSANWGRHGLAFARRHRVLIRAAVEAEEAAHPLRHAFHFRSYSEEGRANQGCASSTAGQRASTKNGVMQEPPDELAIRKPGTAKPCSATSTMAVLRVTD